MGDIFQRVSRLVQGIFEDMSPGHHTDDPLFDQAWEDLEQELSSRPTPQFSPDDSVFEDMDRTFREFDRHYANFKTTKSQASGPKSESASGGRPGQQTRGQDSGKDQNSIYRTQAEQLAQDYRNLELAPGAGLAEVREAYKLQMKRYHPDRFAADPAKQDLAHQICVKLNDSHKRLVEFLSL